MASRNDNGRSSVYKGKDGSWHGRVTVGRKSDGSPDRRHVRASTKAEATRKVRALEKSREEHAVPAPGESWTVKAWLEHWLTSVVKGRVRNTSWNAYRFAVRVHAIPAIGAWKLTDIRPEHLQQLYSGMLAKGSSGGTAHQVHRTLHVAFDEAIESGYMAKNPATRRVAPKVRRPRVEPYTVEEVRKIRDTALQYPGGVRWVVALTLGLRQGELLALQWSDVDLERKTIRIDWSLQRPVYAHGCHPPCGKKPGFCPKKKRTNPLRADTKSDASHRVVGVPAELLRLLEAHREEQATMRSDVGTLWQDGGWVFTDHFGRPLNPNSDYHRWKDLLVKAGIRDARLHDARHTAATMLLLLGVPERAVIDQMGWSTGKMTRVYQHVTDPVRHGVADRLGELLWNDPQPEDGPNPT